MTVYVRCILTACLFASILSTTCVAATTLYQEDFALFQGALPAGWTVHQGNWEVRDESLYFNDAEVWGAIRYAHGGTWQDYALSVEANLESALDPSSANFAIGGRVNESGGGYWLIRSMEFGGAISLVRADDYNLWPQEYLGWTVLPMDGQNHVFTLLFMGSNIRVEVDGVPLILATDSAYSGGSVAFESGMGALSRFDNLVVDPAPTPEPSGLLALTVGALCLGAGMRRRRGKRG